MEIAIVTRVLLLGNSNSNQSFVKEIVIVSIPRVFFFFKGNSNGICF